MPCVGFEPTIPASERANTVDVLDRSATVTGDCEPIRFIISAPLYTTHVTSRWYQIQSALWPAVRGVRRFLAAVPAFNQPTSPLFCMPFKFYSAPFLILA
jgi:hypothetical protein